MAALRGDRNKVGRDDMTELSSPDENGVLENMRVRYASGIIYTSIGAVLVSINPYKDLGVFSKSNVAKFKGRPSFETPPHVFQLAEEAYKALLTQNTNQAVIISGESGAGKTEASKGIMQYIAAITSSNSKAVDHVKDIILESNPLLESFGNARTLRNNNSSRFGKYMEIQFDSAGAQPIGGRISNYLLEKSRVIHQTPGERNFHVFYQLFAGGVGDSSWGLTSPNDFKFLNQSGELKADGISDSQWLSELKHAMKTVGLDAAQGQEIFQILAGILHLGNIEFEAAGDKAAIKAGDSLGKAATLLGMTSDMLQHALLFRGITSGSARASAMSVPHDADGAANARDALAKGAYSRLFDWIVHITNDSMRPEAIAQQTGGAGAAAAAAAAGTNVSIGQTIGILDIYGFEIFEVNSFEQLCINYVNETLHQIFIDLTLRAEQDEYVAEGIPWENIDYHNNKPTVDFLTGRPMGLFKIVDEECLMPRGSDSTFLDKMDTHFGSSDVFRVQSKGATGSFLVKHYAGDVTYQVVGFLDKNRDTMFDDLKEACKASELKTLAAVFEHAESGTSAVSAANNAGAGARRFGGGTGGKARPQTGGAQFTSSVAALLKALYACQPHYIRTIKPNDTKTPLSFNEARVREQARYLGLTENLRVRRAGYCYRAPYERWVKRYGLCTEQTFPPSACTMSDREAVVHILGAMGIASSAYQEGTTKIFVREPQTLYKAEEQRLRQFDRIAEKVKTAKIQKQVVEGNVCLEYLRILIFEELPDFTILRPPPAADGTGGPVTYDSYQRVEADYEAGLITPQELKQSLFQLLTDQAIPVREHVVGAKKKGGIMKSVMRLFGRGKQTTASLSGPA